MATTPKKTSTSASTSAGKKVGDRLEFDGPGAYVCLPGGTVVTARTDYTFRHEGIHVVTVINAVDYSEPLGNQPAADYSSTTETSYNVTAAEPSRVDF